MTHSNQVALKLMGIKISCSHCTHFAQWFTSTPARELPARTWAYCGSRKKTVPPDEALHCPGFTPKKSLLPEMGKENPEHDQKTKTR